jgi:hypothetical protein
MVPTSPPANFEPAVGHACQQLGHHGVVFAFGAGHVEFGRGEAGGQRVQQSAGVLFAAQDLQQAAGGVHGVVKAVPALAEEQVAAHLAGERRAGFLELGLDQRVPGLPQHRLATGLADGHRQALAALHVKDDGSTLVALEDVARKQHDLPVGVDDVAPARDHAQAVAVAVKGQAHFGTGGLDDLDQVGQVLGLARVGVVVGKIAVDLRCTGRSPRSPARAGWPGRWRRGCRCRCRPRSSSGRASLQSLVMRRAYSAPMSILALRPRLAV